MKPVLLAEVLRDPVTVAERCVGLRDALPFANISKLVAGDPALLLEVNIHLAPCHQRLVQGEGKDSQRK